MNRASRHPILWCPWGKERTRRNAMSLCFRPRLLPGDLQGSNDSHSQRDVRSLPFEARGKRKVICQHSQRSKAKNTWLPSKRMDSAKEASVGSVPVESSGLVHGL